MKKTLLFIAIFAMTVGTIFANPVDRQRAQQIGQNFMNAKIGQKTDVQLNLVYTAATREAVDYYVFNNGGDNGFVIVAGDDRVKPILAYSTSGCFNPNDIADGFQFTLNTFSHEIQYIRENNIEATADIDAEWQSIAETGYINKVNRNRTVVGPLLPTIWHQNYPYNSQCPEDPEGAGGHVYAGCVATAMAQVMRFWNWPPQGTGSHTYNPDGYEQQTANFGETEYHFELMPTAIDSTSSEEDIFYIAQFQHHCGIAVDMQYSGHGSGAYSDDVPMALRNYFRYTCDDDVTLSFWGFNFYTIEQWIQMLKDGGLSEGMPLYYSGSDDGGAGGHAFVCDGYDENDYFHFNWGWSGKDDAWCPIGALNTTKYAFNDSNSFIGNIKPNTPDYYLRPENITDFEVVENEDLTGVSITWTNPANDLNGAPLTDFTVYVYRNEELVFQSEGVKGGTRMEITDTDLEQGHYIYSVIAGNEYGFNEKDNKTLLVGSKCDIVFELADEGGNGWKGASISVTDEKGDRIAVITMEEGSTKTVVMPLLSENLNFYWNHGWFHTDEQYDTDYECSFVIKNGDDEILYTSGELSDGLFLEYNNTCEDAVEEIESANNIHLYPNPTNGIVNIEAEGQMTISVINMLGQKILEMNATDNVTIDLSGNGSGIYMVRIETANGTMTEKVSIRK
ncbi:MAG: C10 family peptidase [Bacteroidales bacterium]|nr:C10 family peptidase [Bacteroidales bacterium]